MIDPQEIVNEGRQLFNEGKYWHVHEALEKLWLKREGQEKALLQGLILVAASLVHAGNKKWEVVWPMLDRALAKLENQPEDYYGWNVTAFREHFKRVLSQKKMEIPTV